MNVSDAALVQFNEWMRGERTYESMTRETKAYAEEYLVEYWANVDAMCAAGGA